MRSRRSRKLSHTQTSVPCGTLKKKAFVPLNLSCIFEASTANTFGCRGVMRNHLHTAAAVAATAYPRENHSIHQMHPVDTTRPLSRYVSPAEHYRERNTFSKIFTLFHFPLKCKMDSKSGENWNIFPLHRIPLHYPVGQKFARNCSISYGLWDIGDFSYF